LDALRDERGRSPDPKPVAKALADFKRTISPETPLAQAQAAWPAAVGERIAAVTEVVEEVEGTLYVECRGAVWSQELALMEPRLRGILAESMGGPGPREIRFRTVS
jgi:predicted nucleic acid-binding Zn ribbon protein